MTVKRIIAALDDFNKTRLLKLSQEAVARDFLAPDLTPERAVPDCFQLESELERYAKRISPPDRDRMDDLMRQALKAYAPAQVEFAFKERDKEALKKVMDKTEMIVALSGDGGIANQILSAANGVIDQIIMRTREEMTMPLATSVSQEPHSH